MCGGRFKVTLEPPATSWGDVWHHRVPCRHGHLYLNGVGTLGWASDNRGPLVGRVLEIPGAVLEQDGSDGVNITFPVERFEQVAELVRPRRRRVLSEEHAARLREAGRLFHFGHGSGAREKDQGRNLRHWGDPEHQSRSACV